MQSEEALESYDFPGFYEIPGYSRYVVSMEGEVINRLSGAKLRGAKLQNGYHVFRLHGDAGKTLTWGRHRLLGFVFKNPGCSIENLVINHIDAAKGRDDLENLEWVTYQGNAEHAGKLGLTEKCTPISVRDVLTGEICDYSSIEAYARLVGWTKDKVNWRVKAGETRVFPEGKQYRLKNTLTPWFIPDNVDKALLFNSRSRKTLMRHVLSGEIKEFPSLSEAARYLNLSKAMLSLSMKEDQPVLPGLVQIKFAHDDTPWRTITDPYLEYESHSGRKVIKVVEEETRKELFFLSSKDCCEAMKLKPQALNYRLKSKGKDVYSDGRRYAYYSDTV